MLTVLKKIKEKVGLTNTRQVIRKNWPQLSCVFILFSCMAVLSYISLNRIVERHIYSNAEEVLKTAETIVLGELNESEIALFNASLAIRDKIDEGKSAADIKKYLDELADNQLKSPNGVAGFLAIYGYINGQFLIAPDWIPPEDFREPGRPWHKVAEESPGKIVFTMPYIDTHTGRIIMSVSRSLRGKNGENYGAIALDIDLSTLSDYIQKLRFWEGGYGTLSNEKFIILAHYNRARLGTSMKDFGPVHAGIVRRFEAGEKFIPAVAMKNTGGDDIVAFYQEMSNGWHISIATPYDNYYHDVYYMAGLLAMLALGSTLLLSFLLLKMSEKQLRSDEENRSKSSFLARMSHEIRTPMNTIFGMSELLLHQNVSSEVKEYVSIIHQSGASLLAIINDILDFSKIEAGQLSLENRNFTLSSFINDVINVIRVRVVNNPICFTVNVDPNIPDSLIGDEVRLRQVLINLLNNAVNYTPRGFVSLQVEMQVREDGKLTLIFTVTDSGIGVKEENIGKLFSEFTRLDMERNQGVEGTGLGLSIARMICRKMDGDIFVSSRYGQGSVFTATVVQEVDAHSQALARVESDNRNPVLVLEDKEVYLNSLFSEFEALGVDVTATRTKAEFLSALESGNEYGYAFIPTQHALEIIYEMELLKSPVQIVVMTELRDVSTFQNMRSLLMPAYSATLANILNGVQEKHFTGSGNQRNLMAPSVKVLVVDDISTNLRVAKELIMRYGVAVDTCNDGEESIQMVRDNRYDMVFMDHMMPGMDGLEAAAVIREMERRLRWTTRLPIIALTANVISGQKEMFLQNGMDDLLAKPVEMRKLYHILRKWIPKEKWVSGTTETVAAETENFDDLVIEGVDVAAGIRNAGDSVRSYKDILMEFNMSAPDLIIQIREAMEQKDHVLYTTGVHGMKGALRIIGAKMLGKCVEILEAAGNNKDAERIEKYTETFLKAVVDLSKQIDAALAKNAAKPDAPEGAGLSALQLAAIRTALLDMDITTVNRLLVELSNSTTDDGAKHKLLEMENDILMFEYENAIKKIDDLLSNGINPSY
ncbi:hypothetical protein FACS189475_02440 [Betaproteobacteria bacterium]|nr:hypothetical protein FACS189475_02440 [Betaproteobacteria bacterium]